MIVVFAIRDIDEMRNMDITTLRSFMAVAQHGGVTKASGHLNLTQSAVSMQLKRLEELLGVTLFDRTSRKVALTSSGEQLLSYARRMVDLNDEAFTRLTDQIYEGEIRVGVPHDIIYPYLPPVLKRFAAEFPKMHVHLTSLSTLELKASFERGELDVILTTENAPDEGGEMLVDLPLNWIGAIGGNAWHRRPLPIAFCSNCFFRPGVIHSLEAAQMDWHMVVDSQVDNAVEAAVSADLAIHASIEGSLPPQTEVIEHDGSLPALGRTQICLYAQGRDAAVTAALVDLMRGAYCPAETPALAVASATG